MENNGQHRRPLQLFLNELRRHPLLTAVEEVELAKRVECGDQAAKDHLITSNLRLVASAATRYRAGELPLFDLIQEGVLGLIRARAEARLGTALLRTATDAGVAQELGVSLASIRYVRAALRRAVAALPERERRVAELRYGLRGEPLTQAAVADIVGISPSRVRRLEEAAFQRLAAEREFQALRETV